ncbi:MAG TPA: 16S rRNA (cytidine(1402)-2'-O)-methyltransferase [Fluviicoccus sp.]|nr:16S rRNA (cytidine(1402)-2'-O)-methyltransferase [Fluviicoccus sp.]
MTGVLYVVATPIGNLDDMSVRARSVLRDVSLIAAEDTRHSSRLLQFFDIPTPCTALHDHNEQSQIEGLIARMIDGDSIALISDAGSPLISDPGYRLVAAAQKAGIRVSPVPGACAAIAALSAAGLPSDRFVFEGFLPAKSAARRARLELLAAETRTLIFYEAPHRIADCLQDMAELFGAGRRITLGRELTKTFETVRQLPAVELSQWVNADANQQRGEIVLVVEGAPESARNPGDAETELLLQRLLAYLPVKKAAQLAAELTGRRKNELYDLALTLQAGNPSD